MKRIYLIALIASLASCQTDEEAAKRKADYETHELDSTSTYYHKRYQVYTLEGCEYLVVDCGSSKWGTHKGNCKNPIHQTK